MSEQHEANWYADPMGRHEFRYWDGSAWTDDVSSHGRQSTDPISNPAKVVETTGTAQSKVGDQVAKHIQQAEKRSGPIGPQDSPVSTDLLDQPILVVNQKWKAFEVNTEFAIYDPTGAQVGSVRQVGQSSVKKFVRFFASFDQYFTHKYQLVDSSGVVVLMITRPAKFIKSRVIVQDGAGQEVGQIVQQNVFGKIRFTFRVDGQDIGGIFAENWRAWNFSLKDGSGTEVARVTKTFEGLLKTAFTTADNYVLHVNPGLSDPLRQLVYASAVSIDTALKQDARGLSAADLLTDIIPG